jgi:hypothetical protein
MTQRDDQRVTAYHEAGHAVAGVVLRCNLVWVRLCGPDDPERADAILGRCRCRQLIVRGKLTPRQRDQIERRAVTLCAGGLAEARYTGRLDPVGVLGDVEAAIDLFGLRDFEAAFERAVRRARRLVKQHWEEIRAVADALCERGGLSRREVDELMEAVRLGSCGAVDGAGASRAAQERSRVPQQRRLVRGYDHRHEDGGDPCDASSSRHVSARSTGRADGREAS